jgi:hypothetical protein
MFVLEAVKLPHIVGNVNTLQENMMAEPSQKPARVWPPLSVRFDQDVRAALQKAAKDDRRPVSHLVQKIVADWLKKKGFLK